MKEELQQKLIESIDGVLKFTEQTVEFGKQQAPLLIEEILNYGLATSILWTFAGFAYFGVAYGVYRIGNAIPKPKYSYEKDPRYNYYTVAALIAALGLATVFTQTLDILKITLAPRMYVVQEIRSLIGK